MCQCTPEIRTPFCGKGDCKWPEQVIQPVTKPEGLSDVLPSMTQFKKLNKIQIIFQDFRGSSLEKAVDYANTFNWDNKNLINIETFNRSGTHIVRVWFTE